MNARKSAMNDGYDNEEVWDMIEAYIDCTFLTIACLICMCI